MNLLNKRRKHTMADELPDGSSSGYEGFCSKCKKVIKTNSQGNEIGEHICQSKKLTAMDEPKKIYINNDLANLCLKPTYIKTLKDIEFISVNRLIKRIKELEFNEIGIPFNIVNSKALLIWIKKDKDE
jgi:hypothetical protein